MFSCQFPYGNIQSPICIGPECEIILINRFDSSKNIYLKAIVDSAAVVTVIPEEMIINSGTIVDGQEACIRNADGRSVKVNTYSVQLQIANIILTKRVIALPRKKYALIGRDILNDYKVVLDAICQPEPEWHF